VIPSNQTEYVKLVLNSVKDSNSCRCFQQWNEQLVENRTAAGIGAQVRPNQQFKREQMFALGVRVNQHSAGRW
jgi:hypothetical protein